MGFVIIQHLDPTRESMLPDLLRRETEMPVVEVEDPQLITLHPNRHRLHVAVVHGIALADCFGP
jgi:hypothetical protein